MSKQGKNHACTVSYSFSTPESSDVWLSTDLVTISRPEDRWNGVGIDSTGQLEVSGCVWSEENDLDDLYNRFHHEGDDWIIQDCVRLDKQIMYMCISIV